MNWKEKWKEIISAEKRLKKNWRESLPIESLRKGKECFLHLSRKKKVVILLILAAVIFLLLRLFGGSNEPKRSAGEYRTEEAQRRTITESITGSGTLEPADSYTITTLVKGDVLQADFEVGDQVEADAVLYEIDSADAANSIEQAEISLSESQISYQQKLKSQEDLRVNAPVKGMVVDLTVEETDEVKAGEVIATIRDASIMEIVLPFFLRMRRRFRWGSRQK